MSLFPCPASVRSDRLFFPYHDLYGHYLPDLSLYPLILLPSSPYTAFFPPYKGHYLPALTPCSFPTLLSLSFAEYIMRF